MKFFVVVAVYVLAAVIDTCWTSPLSGTSSSFQNYGYGGSGSFGMVGPTPQTAKQTVCGQVTKSRIVSGYQASPYQFPWQVSIFMDDSYFCEGSIISEEYILTAAHCADGFTYFDVVIGAHEVRNPTVDDIHIHPNYNPKTRANDIALIRLPSPSPIISTFATGITPVCLPKATDTVIGKTLTASDSSAFSSLSQPVGGGSPVLFNTIDSKGAYILMGIGDPFGMKESVGKHVPWISSVINKRKI